MKLTIWNIARTITINESTTSKYMWIRFYHRIERFTIQIFFLYYQILINLEQSAKQYTISNQTYMNKNTMLSIQKHNASVIEELNILCNQLI